MYSYSNLIQSFSLLDYDTAELTCHVELVFSKGVQFVKFMFASYVLWNRCRMAQSAGLHAN